MTVKQHTEEEILVNNGVKQPRHIDHDHQCQREGGNNHVVGNMYHVITGNIWHQVCLSTGHKQVDALYSISPY